MPPRRRRRPPPTTARHGRDGHDAAATAADRRPSDRRPRPRPTPSPPTPPVAIPAEALAKLPKDVASALEAQEDRSCSACSPTAHALAPAGRRRPLRAQRAAQRQPLRRRRVRQAGPAGQALHVRRAGQRPRRQPDAEHRGHRRATSRARCSTGYVDRIAINQVIADARADSASRRTSRTPTCATSTRSAASYETRVNRWSYPTIRGKKASSRRSLPRDRRVNRTYRRQGSRTLRRPAQVARPREALLACSGQDERATRRWPRPCKTDTRSRRPQARRRRWSTRRRAPSSTASFDKAGLTDCAINRRS